MAFTSAAILAAPASADSTAYLEDDGARPIGATIVLPLPAGVVSTVQIVNEHVAGEDRLALPARSDGITAEYDAATGTLTLSGAGDHEDALRSVTYENTSQDPTEATRMIRFQSGLDSFLHDVTVIAVDDPAVAVPDSATVAQDSGATPLDLFGNDTDVDDRLDTVTSVSDPAGGATAFSSAGVTYRPDAGFCGTDSFDYALSLGGRSTVTITVPCPPPADPPPASGSGGSTSAPPADTPLPPTRQPIDVVPIRFPMFLAFADSRVTLKGGRAPLNLKCSGDATTRCKGTVTVATMTGSVKATARFELAAGKTGSIKVKIPAKLLKIVKKRGRTTVKLTARVASGQATPASTTEKRITLLREKRRR